MKNLIVRRANSSDVNAIVRLRLLLQEHVEDSNPLVWRITERGKRLLKQETRKDLSNRNTRVLLAEVGGETIGFAQGEVASRSDYAPRTVGHISLLYVMRRFRRKGVGRRLLRELCKFYNSKKAEHLTVRYIIGNKEAEGFWKQLGFESIISTSATHLKELNSRLNSNAPAPTLVVRKSSSSRQM
jgi:ribosomal protein S18 acetylase RimI-like enzyme